MTDQTQSKLLAAAAREFVERGFEGARVDAIARRAGANKAMIYYHFHDKQGLYQAVLHAKFDLVRQEIARIQERGLPPRERLEAFYAGLVRLFADTPHLPRLMLREVAEGGKHIDPATAGALAEIVAFVVSSLQAAGAAGFGAPTSPLLFHFSMMGPILLYYASLGFRDRIAPQAGSALVTPTAADLERHVHDMIRRTLTPPQETK